MDHDLLNMFVTLIIQEEIMTQDSRQLSIIREYRSGINDPDSRWPDIEFKRASYSQWAVDEIMLLIISHPERNVLQNVVWFKNKMLECSSETSMYHEDVRFIFEIAFEVAVDIEDIITGI